MHLSHKKELVIIGGGAAGFMAAIQCAQNNPGIAISILEQGKEVLSKVRISGGGRCNVTHACFDVHELVNYYPRGSKELISPFYKFNCQHTIDFFESRGVKLKTEADGRMFPVSDDSLSILECLKREALKLNIKIILHAKVLKIQKPDKFIISFNDQQLDADYLMIASGSNKTIWNEISKLNHQIIEPVPSLFTFNSKHTLFRNLSGISLNNTLIKIKDTEFEAQGITLITHLGLSGPCILKLSAFAARHLAQQNYNFTISINWINQTRQEILSELNSIKLLQAKKSIANYSPFKLPNRFWNNVLIELNLNTEKQWAQLNKLEIQSMVDLLAACEIPIFSKNTNKDEFVTAGGISLAEIDFKTMQSKIVPGLYIVGEALNIDALTGGFNFQAAWTTGFIAGTAIAKSASN